MSVTPRKFLHAMKYLEAQTRDNVEANFINGLLQLSVAGSGGLTVGELGDAVGVTHAAASRMARTFTDHGLNETKAAGWGLAELTYDPARPRYTIVKLTSRGRKVIETFLEMLNGD